jgi:predicted dehydrogenase
MLRLGLIGVGAWGKRIAGTVARRADCRLAAYSRRSGPSEILPDVPYHSRWSALVELAGAGELDAVVAATTPDHQAEVTLACAAARVPLLVEKPVGLTPAAPLLALERAEAPTLVDYVHLWAPAFQALKSRASSVASIDGSGHNRGPFRGWSSLHDYGPHDLAMALDLLGLDVPVEVRQAHVTSDGPGELFEANLDAGGVPLHLLVGNGAAQKARRLAVTLTGGRQLVYDDLRPHPDKLTDGGQPLAVSERSPVDGMLDHFLGLVGAFQTGTLRPEQATRSLRLTVRVAEILAAVDRRARI